MSILLFVGEKDNFKGFQVVNHWLILPIDSISNRLKVLVPGLCIDN